MVCWGSLLQLFKRVELKKASVVGNMLQESWIQYFGSPVTVIAALGTEFTGTDFQDRCDRNGVFVHCCDSKAPWQTARIERRGGMMKQIIEKATYEFCPADVEEWLQLVSECNSGKNRLSNRSGYSPIQRVYGQEHRLPGDLASDDHTSVDIYRCLAASDPTFDSQRRMREAGMRAHASVSIEEDLRSISSAMAQTSRGF